MNKQHALRRVLWAYADDTQRCPVLVQGTVIHLGLGGGKSGAYARKSGMEASFAFVQTEVGQLYVKVTSHPDLKKGDNVTLAIRYKPHYGGKLYLDMPVIFIASVDELAKGMALAEWLEFDPGDAEPLSPWRDEKGTRA